MKITIDTEQSNAAPAVVPAASGTQSADSDGGAAPAVTGSGPADPSAASDGGEPPAWLVANIAKAAGDLAPAAADSDDGGSAPA